MFCKFHKYELGKVSQIHVLQFYICYARLATFRNTSFARFYNSQFRKNLFSKFSKVLAMGSLL